MADNPKGLSLFELIRAFPNEDSAVKRVEELRWGGTPTCPQCKSADVYQVATERRLPLRRCRACGHQFTVTAGTVMESFRPAGTVTTPG